MTIGYGREEGLEMHIDLNKAHACPGQQRVYSFQALKCSLL